MIIDLGSFFRDGAPRCEDGASLLRAMTRTFV